MSEFGFSSALPESYVPGPKTVIIGRGKKIAAHPGNVLFQTVIKSELASYSEASSKSLKSSILSKVVDRVRRNCPGENAFVKQDPDTGRWYAVEDFQARITAAQAFRDSLHQSYRSSKKFKQQKRKAGINLMKKTTSLQNFGSGNMSSNSRPTSSRVSQSDGALFRLNQFNKASSSQQGSLNASWGEESSAEVDDNILSLLFERFSSSIEKRTDDPFEPTPLPETPQEQKQQMMIPGFGSFFSTEETSKMEVIVENPAKEEEEQQHSSSCESLKSTAYDTTTERPLIKPSRSSSCITSAVSA